MIMLIENVSENDLAELAELFYTSYPHKLDKNDVKILMEIYLKAAEHFLVARDKGKVVGFLFALKNASEFLRVLGRDFFFHYFSPRWPFLRPFHKRLYFRNVPFGASVVVSTEARKKGVATGLQKELKQRLLKNGCKEMYFEIAHDNIASQKLVKKIYDCGPVNIFPAKIDLWRASLGGD